MIRHFPVARPISPSRRIKTGPYLAMISVRLMLLLALLALNMTSNSVAAAADIPAIVSPTALNTQGYRLYPGDLLRIDIFDHPDLSCQIRIPTSGASSFPLLGNIGILAGKPLGELEQDLSRRLEKDYLKQAVLTATLLEFGPRFAYVLGSVRTPNAVPLHPLRTTTAMQAIAQAGGFMDDANRATAQVIRENPEQPGKKIALTIPSTDQVDALSADVTLFAGDVVIVPRLDRVYVIGKVSRPGALNLPSQEILTVSKAISLSGGFDRFAVQNGVQLVRAGAVITIDVKGILSGEKLEDPVLKQGDTVYVPESNF